MALEFLYGDELFEAEIVNNDPWALAQREGVNFLSDKELLASVVDTDAGMVVAAVANAVTPEHYSFDTVVDHRYQHQGLGKQLIEIAMDEFENMKEAFPDIKLNLDIINPDIISHLETKYGLKVLEEMGSHTIMGAINRIRKILAQDWHSEDLPVNLDYDEDWTLDDYLAAGEAAKERVSESVDVGVEYVSRDGQRFGVLLKEMASDSPYRISWYDALGFSGHSEVASKEAAVVLFVDELGDGVHEAPGSLDKLFQGWPESSRLTARKIIAQMRAVAEGPVPTGTTYTSAPGTEVERDDTEFKMDIDKDRFVHFTTAERAEEIMASGKLLMDSPYDKFGIDAVTAVSTVWGKPVHGVQVSHIEGDIVAILFSTSTIPQIGYSEEVIWKEDVILNNAEIISTAQALAMLEDTDDSIGEFDTVVYR